MKDEPCFYEDEISLVDIFKKIWSVRVPVVICLLLVSLCYWSYWGMKKVNASSNPTYSLPILFTFKGGMDGEYPNGTPFNLADIISPAVLARVYQSNDFDKSRLQLQDFSVGFNIQPYAPDYDLIVEKYRLATKAKNITVEQVSELQKKMKDELAVATSQKALLTFTPGPGVDFAANVIEDIMLDVPKIWAEKAIGEDGAVDLNMTIYTSKIFDDTMFSSLDYTISLDLLLDNISLVKENIKELLKHPNGKLVSDDKTGYRLADLQKNIDDVVNYEIRQLVAPVRRLAISKNEDTVRLFYQDKVKMLKYNQALLLNKAKIVDNVLNNYVAKNKTKSLAEKGVDGNSPYVSMPQLSDGFLDRVIEMTEKSGDKQYRQLLSSQIMKYQKEAAGIDYQIVLVQDVLAQLGSEHKADKIGKDLRAFYVDEMTRKLPIILDKIRGFTDVTSRIYHKLAKDNYGSVGKLYSYIGQRVMIPAEKVWPTKKDILIYILIIILTLFMTGVVFMMRNILKSEKSNNM